MAENRVPVIIQFIADTAKAVSAVKAYAVDISSLKQQVRDFAARGAAVFGGIATSLTALGGVVVQTAGRFEQLEAKFQTLKGDADEAAKAFSNAVKFAASTPFSVESIVAASVQLEAFGHSAEENIGLVANLAAAFGQPIDQVSLRVGKALSGVSEGFQGLRDTAGVTFAELQRFGARLNDAGGIALETAGDVAAANNALKQLVATKYGDAIERQSETLFGAFSNLGDSITSLAAAFGKELIPIVATVARFITGLVERFNSLSEPFRRIIAWGGLAVAAFAGLGAGLFAAAAAANTFLAVIIKLVLLKTVAASVTTLAKGIGLASLAAKAFTAVQAALVAQSGAAARVITLLGTVSTAVSGKVTALTGAMSGARLAALALKAALITGGFLAVAAAVGVAWLALRRLEQQHIAEGKALEKQSRALTGASRQWRQYRDELNAVVGPDLQVDFAGTAQENAEQTRRALDSLSDLELSAWAERNGRSIEDMTVELTNNRKAAAETLQQLNAFREGLANTENGFVDLGAVSEQTREIIQAAFGGRSKVSVEELQRETDALDRAFSQLGASATFLRGVLERLGLAAPKLKEIEKEATRLNDFLKFAGRSEDIGFLNEALGRTEQSVALVRAQLADFGLPTDVKELARFLASPAAEGSVTEEARQRVEQYLDLLEKQAGVQEQINGLNEQSARDAEQAQQARLQAVEQRYRREEALGRGSLARERANIEERLAMVEQGTEEEVRLLEQLADVDERIQKRGADARREQLESQVEAVNDAIADLEAAGDVPATKMVKMLEQGIQGLKAFEAANRQALANNPELAEQLANAYEEFGRRLKTAESNVPREAFTALKEQINDLTAEADTAPEKLEALGRAIELVNQASASGSIGIADADELRADLARDVLEVEREISREKRAQQDELAALQVEGIQQEIALLEIRRQAGEDVEEELKQKRQELLQARLDAIDRELQREIEAGKDRVLAEQIASEKKKALWRDETARHLQEEQKRTKDLESEVDKRDKARNKSNSPLLSPEEAFGTLAALPTFSSNFGKSSLGQGVGGFRPKSVFGPKNPVVTPPTPQPGPGGAGGAGGGGSGGTDSTQDGQVPGPAPTTVINNNNTTVNASLASNITVTPKLNELMALIGQEIGRAHQRFYTVTGPAGQSGS